jgi:hypothetical protein
MSKITVQDQTQDPLPPNSNEVSLYTKGLSLFSIDGNGTVIDYTSIASNVTTDQVIITNTIGYPSNTLTLQDTSNLLNSAGLLTGGLVIPGAGFSVNVTTGTGALRASDDSTDTLYAITFPAVNTISVALDTTIYVGVRYNSGVPEVFSKTSNVWNYNDEFPLGTAVNENNVIQIANDPHQMSNLPGLVLQRFFETSPLAPDLRTGGFLLSDSDDGLRHILMSEGALWDRLNRIVVDAIDTSSGDTFTRYYSDGIGDFTSQTAQSTWDNTQYDDGSGTLASLGTGQYGNQWVWLDVASGELLLMYGVDSYVSLVAAQSAPVPSPRPALIDAFGRLIGRIIAQEGNNIAAAVEGVNDFAPSLEDVGNHSLLTNLTNDDHPQYSRTDGTRDFTGVVAGIDPVGDQDLTTKIYVDNNTKGVGQISGILTGGILTIDGGDNTKVNLTAGTGIIIDWTNPSSPDFIDVSWPAQNLITVTALGSTDFTVFYIDSSGTLQQLPDLEPSPQLKRQNVILDTATHPNMTIVENIANTGILAYQASNALLDYVAALGPINTGNGYSANGATLSVQKAAGTTTLPYLNRVVDPQNPAVQTNGVQAPISPWSQSYQDGVGGFTTVTGITAVDPDLYDDGSGTLAVVPNNNWTVMRFYFFGQTNATVMTPGQAVYANSAEAEAAIFTENPVINPLVRLGTFVTALIVQEAATDLSNTGVASFIDISNEGVSSSGGTGTQDMQSTYDLSTSPEILSDSTRGALTVRRGSAADTDLVFEGQNNAGLTTWGVSGNGLVTQSDDLVVAKATNATITIDSSTGLGQIALSIFKNNLTNWDVGIDTTGHFVIQDAFATKVVRIDVGVAAAMVDISTAETVFNQSRLRHSQLLR